MTVSPRPLLTEIAAGHSGAPIPPAKLAYIQQRLRNRMFNFLLEKFLEGQRAGLTKAALARRIGKTPDLVNRWLGAPSNLTLDTISDLLIGMAAQELVPNSSSPLHQVEHNYSHYADLASRSEHSAPTQSLGFAQGAAASLMAQPSSQRVGGEAAALSLASSSNSWRRQVGAI
jgi:hypothetical protein